MNTRNDIESRILRAAGIAVPAAAIIELALSQFSIKTARLSSAELTGISLFAFVIFSTVTLFAVTRMKSGIPARVFAIVMNFLTALMATWYLSLLARDALFFRNLYYTLNRQTMTYELLPLVRRLAASVPLALVVLGAAVYYLAGIAILIASLAAAAGRKKTGE